MPNAKQTLEYLVNESTGVFKDANEITAQQLRDMTVTAFAGLYSTTAQAVTTGNVNGVVGTMHVLDVSGMTANRDFLLPTTAAVGDRVGVMIKLGDATEELLLKTTSASSDTINGAVADTTEWSRLFITGEVVIFRCVVADTDWIVEYDGRIAAHAAMEDANGQTFTTGMLATLETETQLWDVGDIADTTNFQYTARRANTYEISSFLRIPNIAEGEEIFQWLVLDPDGANTPIRAIDIRQGAGPGDLTTYSTGTTAYTFSAGDVFELQGRQITGENQTTSTTLYLRTRTIVKEILS